MLFRSVGPGTRKTDLFGSKEINVDGTLFNLGIFPRAIEVANHFGHACLYCDEGNTQDPETQKLWNRICDDRKSVFINGKNYKLNPNCKLSIVWTTNPASYVGINSMPEDLRSRFIGEIWKYPTPSQIKKVIDWEKIYINCNYPNVSNGYSQSSQNQVAVPISHEIKELINDRIFPGLIGNYAIYKLYKRGPMNQNIFLPPQIKIPEIRIPGLPKFTLPSILLVNSP